MAGGSKSEKSSKKRKEKTTEKIVFHDCESDNELVQAQRADQADLSYIAQSLEDPNAFHKELQAIVSTTQQLLCKFDSQYKPTTKKYRKRTQRRTTTVSDSERSLRSAKSLLLEIHLQMPVQGQSSNLTFHQVSTQNANVYHVLQAHPALEQIGYNSPQLLNNKSNVENAEKPCESNTTPSEECTAGDHKSILTRAQPNISEKSPYVTPQTSASCFSILTSSQLDIQLLHSQSKLLHLQQPKTQSTEPSKEENPEYDFKPCTSVLGKASNTLRVAGANILFQGKRFVSSISSYMGGYVDPAENQPSGTCNVTKKRYLSPKASRMRQQRAKRKPKAYASSNPQMKFAQQFQQFTLPPEFAALAAKGQTMPALVMFMPPPQDAANSQQQQPMLPLQAFCIPIMPQADQAIDNLSSTPSKPNTKCSTATQNETLINACRPQESQFDLTCTDLQPKESCQTFITINSDESCHCHTESQEQCVAVTQLNEECFETIEDEIECCCCVSDVTLVAAPSAHILGPIQETEPEEPIEKCCARSKRDNCVECANITNDEREMKPGKRNFKKINKVCRCGLKYPDTPKTKTPCTCNADGQLNEDCKLPKCVEQFGVCTCDCDNKQSIVKCCKEAFQETCICTDYNLPKFYRLALPQHKDLNLCIKCRFDPSPLIDAEGKVFCPGDCGCCLCPWQQRPTTSKENLMLHEKVRVCVCRDRGTIFNLSPKNSKCNNPGNFDLCPCRERAEAKFLELYEKEMFKIDPKELNQLSGPAVTLKDVQEVIPLKEKQKLTRKK